MKHQDPWAFEEIGLPTGDGEFYGYFDGRVEAEDGIIEAIVLKTRKRQNGRWVDGTKRIEREEFSQSNIAAMLASVLTIHFADELAVSVFDPRPYRDEVAGGTSAGRSYA